MKIRDRLPLLAVLCCFSALLLLPEVSAQAARDAMLLCAQTLIPSLFPFFVLSSLFIACGASELLSALLSPLMRPLFGLFGYGRGRTGAGSLRRLPRRRTDSCRACGKRCAVARRGRAAARLLQQRGTGISARRVRRGHVFVEPRAALYLIHVAAALCAGLLTCRALPPVPHGTYPHKSAKAQHLSTAFPAAVQNALTGCPQCERVRRVFHGACAAVAALSAGGLRLIAPLRAAAWIFRAHERRAVASLLTRGFFFPVRRCSAGAG